MSEKVEQFCNAVDVWAAAVVKAEQARGEGREFQDAWAEVRLRIYKSCLLDRTLYNGEGLSQTPCPVHKGSWAGCHAGWPGQKWADGTPLQEDGMLRKWYDAGCRCYQHTCGCTTGWQPDEHCGCEKEGVKDE